MAVHVQTWLSPFAAVWRSAYPSASIPYKQLAQALKPLNGVYPVEKIADELKAYLEKTPPQFLNLRKFVATFGAWSGSRPGVTDRKSSGCMVHPERPWVAIHDRQKLCRECFEEISQ